MVLPIPTALKVSWFPTNWIVTGVVFAILTKPPVAVMIPTVILGVPVSPSALVAKVAVDAVPVNAPMKVVAVTTPVILTLPDTVRALVGFVVPIPISPLEVVVMIVPPVPTLSVDVVVTPTVILGVPVSPWAVVAVPINAPTNPPIEVTIPDAFILVATNEVTVETPEEFILPVKMLVVVVHLQI